MVMSCTSSSVRLQNGVEVRDRNVLRGRGRPCQVAPRKTGRRIVWMVCGVLGVLCLMTRCLGFVPVPPPPQHHGKGARAGPPAELASELLPALGAVLGGLSLASAVGAAAAGELDAGDSMSLELTPDTFKPVCPASDTLYSAGKGLGDALLGSEGAEYRPLVIEALLRVRLEICVLESFIYEAIIPFVQRKGLSWVLPLHETIDTVIAGTVFTVAINFVLFGTTKVLAILSIYHDFLIGALFRLIGFALLPEENPEPREAPLIQINFPGFTPPEADSAAPAEGKGEEKKKEEVKEEPSVPVTVIGNFFKGYGIISGVLKDVLEGLDTFAGRYLVVTSILYVGFKWAHFRLFNDFPPF